MSIRDAIAKFPKAGTIKTMEVPGLGTIGIKRLSQREMNNLPSEDFSAHLILQVSCGDEGKPLFSSLEEVHGTHPAVLHAIILASNEVNTLDLEKAAKN